MAGQRKRDGGGFPFTIVRHVVQVLAWLLFLAPVIAAGWSLLGGTVGSGEPMRVPADLPFYGTLSSSSVFGFTLLDPFAVLQMAAASRTFEPEWLVGLLPALVVYGLVRGRSFCGWVCPVNLLCEVVDWARGRLRLKPAERVVPRRAKVYVAAGALVLSAVLGFPLFEALSPVGFVGKGMVLGSAAGGATLLAIVLAELFWGRRAWCRALCPLGGFYEAIGRAGLVNVRIDHAACIDCDACKQACICDSAILDAAVAGDDAIVRPGDCMLCGKCVEACPTAALSIKLGR